MILITGATGNLGTELRWYLRESGHPAVSMVRREQAFETLTRAGYDTVLGDFDDAESLRLSLQGIEKAFLVCTPDEHLEEREMRFIRAAKRAGVREVVKVSALLATPDSPSPILRMHGAVEESLKASGMAYTILRPHGFMQTFFWMMAPAIRELGTLPCPAGDGRCAYIDLRNVARAAWVALTEEDHGNKTYELTGSESLSKSEIAARLSAATGQPINYVDIPEVPMLKSMHDMGVPESAVEHVAFVFQEIRRHQLAFTTDTLAELGIEATTWEQCAEDLAAGTTGAATSFVHPSATPLMRQHFFEI